MTDKELWDAIHAHNKRQRARDRKLTDLRKLLPPPGKVLTLKEFVELLKRFREILEALDD